MADNKPSTQSVEKVHSLIENSELFVLDSSALMFMADDRLLQWLAKSVSSGGKKVAVCKEFYRCYSIVAASENAKQKDIARKTKAFIGTLKEKKALVNDSNFKTADDLVNALNRNPKVAFIVGEHSEAAEALCACIGAAANVLAVTCEGKIYCCAAKEFAAKKTLTVNNDPGNSKKITLREIPSENSCVKTSDGELFILGKRISKGAEGTVYFTDNPKYVCKIYHKGQMTVQRCRKLKLFEERPVEYEGICWPEKTVYDSNGMPAGYIMKKASGKTLSSVFDGDEELLANFPAWKRSDLVATAIKILEKIRYLHLLGVIVGDIRMQNIMIDASGNVHLIDMDSCQINDFPCPFGDEDYTPPENQSKLFSDFLRSYENEKFSCAVLTFCILFLGMHPYSQKNGAETMAEEIAARSFPYPQKNDGESPLAPAGGYDLIWNHLPQPLCSMFYGAFKEDNRPSLTALLLLLDSYKKYLTENCDEGDPLQLISYYGYSAPEIQPATKPQPQPEAVPTAKPAKKEKHPLRVIMMILALLIFFCLALYIFTYAGLYIANGSAELTEPAVFIYETIISLTGGQ